MADVFSRNERSRIMARVHSNDTLPELIDRSKLHRPGFRFVLSPDYLPGKPDIVLPRFRKLIFVYGCIWHQHKGCKASERPSSNLEYWNKKLEKNIIRDRRNVDDLREAGWDILILWECQIRKYDNLERRLKKFMNSASAHPPLRRKDNKRGGTAKGKRQIRIERRAAEKQECKTEDATAKDNKPKSAAQDRKTGVPKQPNNKRMAVPGSKQPSTQMPAWTRGRPDYRSIKLSKPRLTEQ